MGTQNQKGGDRQGTKTLSCKSASGNQLVPQPRSGGEVSRLRPTPMLCHLLGFREPRGIKIYAQRQLVSKGDLNGAIVTVCLPDGRAPHTTHGLRFCNPHLCHTAPMSYPRRQHFVTSCLVPFTRTPSGRSCTNIILMPKLTQPERVVQVNLMFDHDVLEGHRWRRDYTADVSDNRNAMPYGGQRGLRQRHVGCVARTTSTGKRL